MIKSTVILGSTGSIGRQSVEVCKRLGIRAAALTTNKNIDLLLEQTKVLHPSYVAAFDADASERLRAELQGTDVIVGRPGKPDLLKPLCVRTPSALSPPSPEQWASGPRWPQ